MARLKTKPTLLDILLYPVYALKNLIRRHQIRKEINAMLRQISGGNKRSKR